MLNRLTALDQRGFLVIARLARTRRLQRPALLISASGDGPLYLYLCCTLMLFDSDGERLFRLCLCAFLLELPLYLLLKNSIRRIRPCHSGVLVQTQFEPSDRFSLPSGHTAAAFVMCFAIAECYPPLWWPALAWASLIGLSRVALGVHYPADIVAGAALGGSCVALVS